MSQNLFKNILFDQISMCCWPRILAQIDPNRSFFTLVPPPCGQQYVVIRLRAGVSNCLKICSKKTLLEQLSVCCWPRMFVKIAPNRSAFTFGPPPSGHQYVEIRLRGRGGQTSQNLCKNSLFEQISMCCWPRIFVKIDPNRSFFTSGGSRWRPCVARIPSQWPLGVYDRCGAVEAPWRPVGDGVVGRAVAVSLGQGAGRAGYHNNRAGGQDVGQQVSHSCGRGEDGVCSWAAPGCFWAALAAPGCS